MSDASDDVKLRLHDAQLLIAKALAEGDTQNLPNLVDSRDADIRTLAELVAQDESLKVWAREYMRRDNELLDLAMHARGRAADQLKTFQRNKTAQRSYIGQGIRR